MKTNERVAIIGGGVNGIFISWRLCKAGYSVDLYEQGKVLKQTSSSSSKLLHGGIRYLEHGHLGLVKQALSDRAWWINAAPEFCKPIEIILPVYDTSKRSALKLFLGAVLYRLLAGRKSLGNSSWKGKKETIKLFSEIQYEGLKGAVSFYDAQMNEEKLGLWLKNNAVNSGVNIFENHPINFFSSHGTLETKDNIRKNYHCVVNATGPWASYLNKKNQIETSYDLSLIRGSHIVLDREIRNSFLFQENEGERVIFVLPYLGRTLVGTTEIPHSFPEEIKCSIKERKYLLNVYNSNLNMQANESNIIAEFSGLRPVVISKKNTKETYFSYASREAKLESSDRLLTVYGGKWTSAPSLSMKAMKIIKSLENR
jgi:glycerol-3-phosphate dehydrogenase